MQNPLPNFLRASLIPELRTDIPAGTPCHIHLILVGIAAVRTLPDKLPVRIFHDLNLPVIIADLAVIALGI